jgi:hypothetical protein
MPPPQDRPRNPAAHDRSNTARSQLVGKDHPILCLPGGSRKDLRALSLRFSFMSFMWAEWYPVKLFSLGGNSAQVRPKSVHDESAIMR